MENKQEMGRAVAQNPNFRWMFGMLDYETGLRFDENTDDWEGQCPDLEDIPTIYNLLFLVREKKDDYSILMEVMLSDEIPPKISWQVSQWWTYDSAKTLGEGQTEGEAVYNAFMAL